uniref:Uncharacterized protein n=1 Tax=Glossina morsitans morsitans TaxID=37546 RepID=A0A1B0FA17_GLOMM
MKAESFLDYGTKAESAYRLTSVSEFTPIVFDDSKAHTSLADNIRNSLEATKVKKNLHIRINISCSKLSKQYLRASKYSRKAVSSRKRASSSKHNQHWLINSLIPYFKLSILSEYGGEAVVVPVVDIDESYLCTLLFYFK